MDSGGSYYSVLYLWETEKVLKGEQPEEAHHLTESMNPGLIHECSIAQL